MLTKREYQQLITAIDVMYSINVCGDGRYGSLHNIKVLIAQWVEDDESQETETE